MNNLLYYLSSYEQLLNESIEKDDIDLFNKCIDNVKYDSDYYNQYDHSITPYDSYRIYYSNPIYVLLNLSVQPKNFSYFLESLLDKGFTFNTPVNVISDELCDVIVKKKYKPDTELFLKIMHHNLHIAKQIIENGHVLTNELFQINYNDSSILQYLKFLLENGAYTHYNYMNIIEFYINKFGSRCDYDVIQFFVEYGIKITKDIDQNPIFQGFIHSKKLEQLETLNTKEIHEYI